MVGECTDILAISGRWMAEQLVRSLRSTSVEQLSGLTGCMVNSVPLLLMVDKLAIIWNTITLVTV